MLPVHTVSAIPEDLTDADRNIYVLPAARKDDAFYLARVDRNLGWLTEKEQQMLRGATVGMASVGGIGGAVSMMLLRSGVGKIKLADLDTFDTSNLNRQFGATKDTVGVSKLKCVVRELRAITDDVDLVLYPTGITEETVDHFLDGCDIVLDGIDFWAVGARILLQERARARGIPVLNCSTVGYGSRIFLFDPKGASMADCLGMTYEEAKYYEELAYSGRLVGSERVKVASAIAIGLLPEPPSYADASAPAGNIHAIRKLVMEKGTAPGLGASCWLACSFVSNQILMWLVKDSGIKRNVQLPPPAPGYLYLDVGFMKAKVCKGGGLNRLHRRLKIYMINQRAKRQDAA